MTTMLIETDRLSMRPFTLKDAHAVLRFNSNPQVTRYTGDGDKVRSLLDAEGIIQQVWVAERKKYGYSRLALINKSDGEVIGFAGLKYLPEEGKADLGYRMLPEYWGQGLGFEAAKACLDFAFNELRLPCVMALAMVDNHGSNRILQKLQFQSLGQQLYLGELVYRYEMTLSDYQSRQV